MATPARMQAAYITAPGPAQDIRVGELPIPPIGPSDVLVAVQVVTVDPVDTFIRSGRDATALPFPFIIGRDLAGEVAAAGSMTPFFPGDQVWCNSLGHDGRQGSFAQYAVVPADRLYRLPEGMSPDLAVALAHPAATACLAWFDHAGLRPGETVYVGGAAGSVGHAAVQLARAAGARILASARPADQQRCRDAGADEVADYRDPDLAGVLRRQAPAGVDVFWDTSGQQSLDLAAAVLRPGGRVLLTAGPAPRVQLPVTALYTRDIALLGFVISRARTDQLARAAALINQLAGRGALTTRIAADLPLSSAAEAHAELESGRVRGRILLRP
jgi:NADPH:quinone reductase-like Zn-dependent oxidoreductase